MKIAEKNTSRKKSEIEKSLQLGMLLHRQTFVTASNAGVEIWNTASLYQEAMIAVH